MYLVRAEWEVAVMAELYQGRKVVRGMAEGESVVCPGSFSFLGDVDMDSGVICARTNPNFGISIQNKVLIYSETKGSSGGCVVLMTLKKRNLAPAALATVKPADYNLAEGAILCGIPFVCDVSAEVLAHVQTGSRIKVNADEGELHLL
jgi:predicted aconitase with swiveling domain